MRISILLIEDDLDFGEFVKWALSRPQISVDVDLRWEKRLSAGLDYLREFSVDLVIADLGLPDSDGATTVERVSAISQGWPFMVLSSEDRESAMWEVMCHGAEDHITKVNLDPGTLLVAIVNAVARHLGHSLETATLCH